MRGGRWRESFQHRSNIDDGSAVEALKKPGWNELKGEMLMNGLANLTSGIAVRKLLQISIFLHAHCFLLQLATLALNTMPHLRHSVCCRATPFPDLNRYDILPHRPRKPQPTPPSGGATYALTCARSLCRRNRAQDYVTNARATHTKSEAKLCSMIGAKEGIFSFAQFAPSEYNQVCLTLKPIRLPFERGTHGDPESMASGRLHS